MKNFLILLSLIVSFSSFAGTKQDAEDATKRKDYATALKLWMVLAENNDTDAQFWVGNFYDFGKGIDKNSEKAFYWYLKAANNGEITSQLNVGNMYYNGIGISKDLKQSATWYKKAADRGDEKAQYNFGNQLHKGEGVKKDTAKAYLYFKMAAMNGYIFAMHAMGLYSTDIDKFQRYSKHENGMSFIDVEKNGLRWFKIAADSGNENSIEILKGIASYNEIVMNGGDLGAKIGESQTGIKENKQAVFARPGVYIREDAKRTKFGDIAIFNELQKSTFIFKNERLNPSIESSNRISIDRVIELNGNVYILIMIDNGDKNCYGNFRWITLTAKDYKITDTFGNCSGIADLFIQNGVMSITMPKNKYGEKHTFDFGG